MKFFFDSYERKARVYPAILVIFPFLILQIYYLNPEVKGWNNMVDGVRTFAMISLPLVFLYLIVAVARLISKHFFENWYFKDSLHMPTTDLLLYSDTTLSRNYKDSVRDKVYNEFTVSMPTANEEAQDELESRKRIVEAVGYIRNKMKDGYLLLKFNIQYGFWRNLVGGAVIGFIISLLNIYIFHWRSPQTFPFVISLILALMYFLIIVTSKAMINFFGRQYARRLFEEFLMP